jgi:hypothetical protein
MKPVTTNRRATGLIEAICEHGVGHPVYGSVDWLIKVSGDDTFGIHACDGCCKDNEWQIDTLKASVRRANEIIYQQKETLMRVKTMKEFFDDRPNG